MTWIASWQGNGKKLKAGREEFATEAEAEARAGALSRQHIGVAFVVWELGDEEGLG